MMSKFTNMFFPICSFVISLFIFIVYFSKARIKSKETMIYTKLVIVGLIESSLYTFICLIAHYVDIAVYYNFFSFLNKALYVIYILWFSLFYLYINCVTNNSRLSKLIGFFDALLIILILYFRVDIFFDPSTGLSNSSGSSSNVLFIGVSLFIILLIFKIMANIKTLNHKKVIPLYLLIILMIITLYIRAYDPLFSIYSNVLSLVVLVMYFTIENPDLKLLNEYTQNKELVESNIESKINMLFKVSEDVKSPLKNIKKNAINILNANKKIEKDDYAKKIYNESNNVLNDINEVFNVSSIDNSKVKIVDTTFNIYNLYDEIIYIVKNKINENTNFKYSITNTIPRLLYADNVRIKQIIVALLLNSISDKEGIIDLDVFEIVKNDICRLVIVVQSSYIKLDLNEINNILNSNVNITNDLEKYDISLKDVKKLIDVIGGTLLINDNDGIMNFKIIINEKIKTNKNKDSLDLIASKLTNKKKVLLASDDYLELSTFTNILKKNNFTVDTAMYYKDIISKLNGKTKYDLLIIDDEMNDESAVSIIKEINKLKINHLIKIVLLDNDKELIKKYYLENNTFDEYIFKSNFKEGLKKVTTKYK